MLRIVPFQSQDQTAVKELILAGLVEHWGFLDASKNPDLEDIAISYAGGTFLVGWLEGRIVGCGALVPRSDQTAEVVRMSVAKAFRRHGIGRQILKALTEAAKQQGYKRIILETTSAWYEVIAFYLNAGFQITHEQEGDTYLGLQII